MSGIGDILEPTEELGETMLPAAESAAGNAISLSLADLLPDSSGAIVIEGESEDLSVRIVTDATVIDAGVVEQLVTATGEDVSGHAYFAFENGTTLYAPRDLDLLIVNSDV